MAKAVNDDAEASRHREVERKFDVLEETPGPSFDGFGVIATVRREPPQTLNAIYFDTPGRDLAARRITLRRRTGGTDAGWHLKLPAEDVERIEIHAGLGEGGDDGVPAALLDVVLAVVRDRPLVPVARITNHRNVEVLCGSDGSALAEFCDDHVIASVEGADTEQRWREWELELAENAINRGTADLRLLERLSERLGDAGATPAQHASKLARTLGPSASVYRPVLESRLPARQALAEQIEALLVWDRAVRAEEDDSVHQMRVALRAIRSHLQSSPASFGLTTDTPVLDELGELAAILGTARDAEVLGDRYSQALDSLAPELVRGPIRERLVEGSRERYRAELRKSLSAMRSQTYFRLLDSLEALLLAAPPSSEVQRRKGAKVAIADAYRRVRKRAKVAAAADPDRRDAALHALRKSAKRLRYTAAAAGAKDVARAARTIQSLLGEHHDSVVSRGHLVEQADLAHAAGEDTFTYGLLHEREAQLSRSCEGQVDAALVLLKQAVNSAL